MPHTEFSIKIEFPVPNREALKTFAKACKEATQLLSVQGAMLSGETPTVELIVENNEIGRKELKVFNGEEK